MGVGTGAKLKNGVNGGVNNGVNGGTAANTILTNQAALVSSSSGDTVVLGAQAFLEALADHHIVFHERPGAPQHAVSAWMIQA
jgi:hypothetical protein